MRHSIFRACSWAGAAAIVLLTVAAIAVEPPGSEGLVAFWSFDGTLNDRAGAVEDNLTACDGTARFVTADQLPATSGGAIALGVDSTDVQYLTAPMSADVKLGGDYTIEMWIHPTDVGGWNRLVLNWGAAPKYAYHVAIHDGLLSLYHGQSSGQYTFAEGGAVIAGRWHHVAAVAAVNENDPVASQLIVYLNGQKVGSAPFDGTTGRFEGEGLGVGDSAGIPGAGSRYRGYLDDLAIWKRSLGEDEIRRHYDQRAKMIGQLEQVRRAKLLGQFDTHGVDEIIFAERGYGRDIAGHYYANFGYSCVDPNVWFHAADGTRLCRLNLRTGELSVLLDDAGGSIRDPQVHYSAQKILLSYRKAGTHRYHLFEINVDGTGLRQITDGPWDDVEPTYLPNGDIVFCSTRCRRWIGCWLAETAVLFSCNADGEKIRMLSSGSFTENTPAVLGDGRILYTRWEYVNRDPVSFHHLWTMNPDGTSQMVYFGNMHAGGVFIDAKPIPDTDQVVLINSPGHGRNEHQGYVAALTVKAGPNARNSMKNISRTAQYRDPYPLSNDAFLVAKGHEILLMDRQGQTQSLYTSGHLAVHEPRPLRKQAHESVVPTRSDYSKSTATLLVSDVYFGRNMAGLERGTIKKMLVMEDLPKPANFHGGGSQPLGHGVTSTLKRILGTVPVEADGSACFQVPAGRSIYFALQDENGKSIKQMRSFVTLQPGEIVGCIGCHESREKALAAKPRKRPMALLREPSRIEPIADAPQIFDYPRDIQPIFDRHCLGCHDHRKRQGGIALTGDHGPVFSHSYYTLYLNWQIKDTGGNPQHGTGRQGGNDKPYTTYSSASPLMDKLEPAHYDVQMSRHEKKLVRLWIDTGATYAGTYAAYGTGQVGGCWRNNEPIRVMADDWPSTKPAQEAIGRRCGACHPANQLPRHVTAQIATDHGDMLSWTRPLSRFSRHNVYNLTNPDKSLILMAALSHQAGGYARGTRAADIEQPMQVHEDRSRPPQAVEHPIVFKDANDADYQKILAHIRTAGAKLREIKRFDMPAFRPNEHYVREMKRYGVLPASFEPANDPIDVYAADQAYFRMFWHRPTSDRKTE